MYLEIATDLDMTKEHDVNNVSISKSFDYEHIKIKPVHDKFV